MAKNERTVAVETTLAAQQADFARAMERAESMLEAARVEFTSRVDVTATRVAELRSLLEMYREQENAFRADETLVALVAAEEEHKSVVDGANWYLKDAMCRYTYAISGAARDMQMAVIKAAGRRE